MMTVQCCKCKRLRLGDEWVEPLEHKLQHASHTYCPQCADETRLEYFSALASQARQPGAAFVSRLLRGSLAASPSS
jgi:hypothetical protein